MNKSLLIEKAAKLSYNNGCLVVERADDKLSFPLCDVDTIVIDNCQSSVSTALIKALSEDKIDFIFCNEKHLPCSRLEDLRGSSVALAKLNEQLSWEVEQKARAWQCVLNNKISNQAAMSKVLCGSELCSPSMSGAENQEGCFARAYFNKLFGKNFVRHAADDINAMLNYGYSFLLSKSARVISSRGYVGQLGLHHCAKTNNNNFACDIMEPFRPCVDKIVYYLRNEEFIRKYRLELMGVYNQTVYIDGKKYILSDAIEVYFDSVCTFLNRKSDKVSTVAVA